MMNISLTTRLISFFSVLVFGVLLVLGWTLSQAIEHHFEEMDLAELHTKNYQIEQQLKTLQPIQPLQMISQLEHLLPAQAGWQFVLFDEQGEQYYASDRRLTDFRLTDLSQMQLVSIYLDENHYRSWFPPAYSPHQWQVWALLNVDHHDHFHQYFMQILWMTLLIALLMIAALGWFVINRGLAPLGQMTELASNVSGEHLGERLKLESLPQELRELAGVFNAMLDRLEASFQRLSQFSADIAHELRTPVNTLFTQSQVALSKPRSLAEYQDILASNIEEFERLGRIISDMLFLAKADKGWLVPQTETVQLATEAQRVIDYYQLLASERDVQIRLQGDAHVRGDSVMLGRALANLLSNAVRHANSGSVIELTLKQTPAQVLIEVENQGKDIPPEHWAHLFDRFYRVEKARSAEEGGVGLGLAITRSIVQAHGGSIELCSANQHTCFRIRIPTRR
ncbi:MAG: heavy metal sensor histidine kinase [Thiomicrospira sp.]